ncbi:tail fiber domain-containing protein, partial [bacterium]|nr:tail fiber domain-containing protein [bacterium]
PQVWDVVGNEANFFIRDVTNGSALPFRLRPGAEGSTIDVGSDSQIGLGTANAGAKVHIQESDDGNGSTNAAALIIENTSRVKKPRHMLYIVNNGAATVSFEDTTSALNWFFGTTLQGDFRIGFQGAGGSNLLVDPAGDVTALAAMNATAFNVTSDRALKAAVTAVDPGSVLAAVADLPVSTWSFIGDGDVRHLGPMAQDFAEAFGLGDSSTTINVADAAGVSLAAIQALAAENRELTAVNADLQARIEALEAQMAQLLDG